MQIRMCWMHLRHIYCMVHVRMGMHQIITRLLTFHSALEGETAAIAVAVAAALSVQPRVTAHAWLRGPHTSLHGVACVPRYTTLRHSAPPLALRVRYAILTGNARGWEEAQLTRHPLSQLISSTGDQWR